MAQYLSGTNSVHEYFKLRGVHLVGYHWIYQLYISCANIPSINGTINL